MENNAFFILVFLLRFTFLGNENLAAFSGVFQGWIQRKALDGQLIDVADYRHVFEGPSVVLIGHDGDYTIEKRDGRLGLLFTRKPGWRCSTVTRP